MLGNFYVPDELNTGEISLVGSSSEDDIPQQSSMMYRMIYSESACISYYYHHHHPLPTFDIPLPACQPGPEQSGSLRWPCTSRPCAGVHSGMGAIFVIVATAYISFPQALLQATTTQP